MSDLALHFPIVTFAGYSASCFSDLFKAAKEFSTLHPEFYRVQFEFNGQLIQVHDHNHDEAWAKYLNAEFQKV